MSIPSAPAPEPGVPTGTLPDGGSSSLADGEWHRMHPLTPLFKGGLVLLIVAGILVANMRDRIISWFVKLFAPEEADYLSYGGDPVDWVLANNLLLIALLAVVGLIIVLVVIFWVIWRFHQFRITGSHVEVRKGLLFRSQRRAPLDRVQGVNLTRPFPARLIGLAKIEVVGAGNDSNVDLEYLATSKAEAVRKDILRLASGARNARLVASGGAPAHSTPAQAGHSGVAGMRDELVGSMNAGVTGLIAGVDLDDVAPESVVKIPTGRLIGSQLVNSLVWVGVFGIIYAVAMVMSWIGMTSEGDSGEDVLIAMLAITFGMGIPLVIAIVGITWAQISRSLRYAIAPTPDGIRLTFGLLTTITETLPPGRIFAVAVTQSLLWRPFGWWSVKINRMSGKSASQQQSGTAQQFNIVLPVGKRADVERVLGLILPDLTASDLADIWERGVEGRKTGEPFHTIPARAAWRHPFTWKRQGWALTRAGLLLRKGWAWRRLAIFPLARLQGISVTQGPLSRAQRIASAQAHSVAGPVSGAVASLDRSDAIALLDDVARATANAVSTDHSHRWAENASVPVGAAADAPSAYAAPASASAPAAAAQPTPPPYAPPASPATPPPFSGD
ncbi:membrane-flanked domain [Microbacterium esteraromaticum]|uniref:Membrane-flanked domain n=1 Tax=Microbacterium esteraromaticum TaxID=57043 RepID=A0A1R4KP60_9MICO|nr:PH domain-containing protein [Microbacterium esteraromaticum]SJN46015.1 membrane-flanked domain [Microbacterium esteraromaticum]